MNPFFIWLIKSSVTLALLYVVFKLSLSRDKMHTANRFVLLGILGVSAMLPLLNIQFLYHEITLEPVQTIREYITLPITQETGSEAAAPIVASAPRFSINPWVVVYLLFIVLFVLRLLFGVIKVVQIIKRAEKRRLQKIVLAVVKDFIQPFTFLNKVVLSEKDFSENKNIIIAHEHAHIKHLHAIDLVVCELFTVLHFFNPFMWLLRHDLKLIHEYQADEAVLNKGIDAQKYQLLLLEKAVGERRFAMANHFTQKPILKRLTMMTKTKHQSWGRVKLILFVPLIAVLLQAFARPELITRPDDFIPVKYTEDKSEKWLAKWTVMNIGHGVFQPFGLKKGEELGKHNKLRIMLNRNKGYYLENKSVPGYNLKEEIKQFVNGVHPEEDKTVKSQEVDIPLIGKTKVFKTMVILSYDKESSVEAREIALRKIGETYLEVRQQKAYDVFKEDYFDLSADKRNAVDQAIPILFGCSSVHVYSPEPIGPLTIHLTREGKIRAGNQEYSMSEFESFGKEHYLRTKEIFNKHGHEFNLNAEITVEDGVSENDLQSLERVLKEIGIKKINKERTHDQISFLPPPAPFIVTMKNTGVLVFGKIQFDSLLDFKERCLEKGKKFYHEYDSEHPTRPTITFLVENGVSENEIQSLKQVLKEVGIQNISVKQEAIEVAKKHENISFSEEQKRAQVDRDLAKTENQKLKKVVVHLNQNKLNFNGKFCKLENIKSEVERYIEKNPETKTVELVLHQPAELSEEITEKVKEELNKIDGVEVKVMAVEVMDIKKDSQPKEKTDGISELFIPEGFSPNGDGIHDFFEIKGIYPQNKNAKLAIFNSQGQKVFEKQNYGNTNVWGKGKEWWDGTSENGKLSAGNYNYVLELGNGEVKKGTLLLALSPSSEQSYENVKQGSATNYSTPFSKFIKYNVIISSDKLQAFNKICTVENVKQEVEESLKSMDGKKTISVLSFSDVPQERSRAILNELNQIPFAKVSTTVFKLEPKPASVAQHKILLKANGRINLDNKEYSINEFESKIREIGNQSEQTNVAFEVENDVTYLQSETVLNVLREANINQVGYSVQKHFVRETEPGTKIGEPLRSFGYSWTGSGPVDLDKLKRDADSFLSGKGNRSLYTSILPDKNATQEDIEAVKKVLLDAGFKKVEIRKSWN